MMYTMIGLLAGVFFPLLLLHLGMAVCLILALIWLITGVIVAENSSRAFCTTLLMMTAILLILVLALLLRCLWLSMELNGLTSGSSMQLSIILCMRII